MKLYDNAFSPFARKIRLVLDHKQLPYEVVNGLAKSNREALEAVNSRAEVPALVDGDVVISNSSHIVAYLEHAYPDRPVYPSDPALRAKALSWERCADTGLDSILVNISYWGWADRSDEMPEGLLEKAKADLAQLYQAYEEALTGRDYLCGGLSVADFASFPHLTAVRALKVPFEAKVFPNLAGWMARMMSEDICNADIERLKVFFQGADLQDVERQKIFWRGDRIEWMLARGYHDWFLKEIREGRVLWPGLALPD